MSGITAFTPAQRERLRLIYEGELGPDLSRIEKDYGSVFIEIVGKDTLSKIPEVGPEELGIIRESKYHNGDTQHSGLIKKCSKLRCYDLSHRPVLALRIELLDRDKNKICEVVELVYKRYTNLENVWVTNQYNTSTDGFRCRSALYSSGGMTREQILWIKDLLDGKIIEVLKEANVDGIVCQSPLTPAHSWGPIAKYARLVDQKNN